MGTALAFFLFYEGSNLFFAYENEIPSRLVLSRWRQLESCGFYKGSWEQGFRFILLASLYLKGCLLTVENQVSGSSSQSLEI